MIRVTAEELCNCEFSLFKAHHIELFYYDQSPDGSSAPTLPALRANWFAPSPFKRPAGVPEWLTLPPLPPPHTHTTHTLTVWETPLFPPVYCRGDSLQHLCLGASHRGPVVGGGGGGPRCQSAALERRSE